MSRMHRIADDLEPMAEGDELRWEFSARASILAGFTLRLGREAELEERYPPQDDEA